MAYSFQTFTTGQVLTAVQMNQVEANVRDHTHGSSGVNANFVSFVGSALTANSLSALVLTSSRAAVNSLSANNAIVNSTFNAASLLYHNTTERLNIYHGRVAGDGSNIRLPTHPATWVTSFNSSSGTYLVTHSFQNANYTLMIEIDHVIAGGGPAGPYSVLTDQGGNTFTYRTVQHSTNGNVAFVAKPVKFSIFRD